MAIRDLFKISFKTFFNPSAWLNYTSLREQTILTKNILANLFTIPKPTRQETFAAAMKRQQLNEADIKKTMEHYTYYAWLFTGLGIFTVFFGFYLAFHHHTFSGWALAMSSAALFFAQSFKYDFWAFQIKKRKLGCSFQEWKNERWRWRKPS